MPLFSIGSDWGPTSSYYPPLYLVDLSWYEQPKKPTPTYELFSQKLPLPTEQDWVNKYKTYREFHGEMTLAVLADIAPKLSLDRITLVSAIRTNIIDKTGTIQPIINIPEAIESIRFSNPVKGSIIHVNLASMNAGTILLDEFICKQLYQLTAVGCIVIVSAANDMIEISTSNADVENGVIVVGAYSTPPNGNGNMAESNYGSLVTCYYCVPLSLVRYTTTIQYGGSSAASAVITGLVMLMQNYALTKRQFLTSAEVKTILRDSGKTISIHLPEPSKLVRGTTPVWSEIRRRIDSLIK